MNLIELLKQVELEIYSDFFIDLHILNDRVVGFYKTRVVKYKNNRNQEMSYLFPTTFRVVNNNLEIVMTLGSVDRHFIVPNNINGTEFGTELDTLNVQNHLYKLLIAKQLKDKNDPLALDIKSFVCIIEALDNIGFPFMRIEHDTSRSGQK